MFTVYLYTKISHSLLINLLLIIMKLNENSAWSLQCY